MLSLQEAPPGTPARLYQGQGALSGLQPERLAGWLLSIPAVFPPSSRPVELLLLVSLLLPEAGRVPLCSVPAKAEGSLCLRPLASQVVASNPTQQLRHWQQRPLMLLRRHLIAVLPGPQVVLGSQPGRFGGWRRSVSEHSHCPLLDSRFEAPQLYPERQ
jgi:hypothetical protein